MKRFSKILCAVLVFAVLCSSVLFAVGAAEPNGLDLREGFTAEKTVDASAIVSATKYDAADNIYSYFSFASGVEGGWGADGARTAYLITDSKTGNVIYHETAHGDLGAANEYSTIQFNTVTLAYEEGKHEYIIIEYDASHKANAGTHIKNGESQNSENLKQQLIARNSSAGTSWGNAGANQFFKDFLVYNSMSHYTTVYDFTSGNAYIFVNGVLKAEHKNNALGSGQLAKYLEGETTITTSELRIGSNSCDDLYFDNVYVRHIKNDNETDTLAAAITSGKLSAWDGNVYGTYEAPELPYFAPNMTVTGLVGNTGSLTDNMNAKDVAENRLTSVSPANQTNSPFLSIATVAGAGDAYTLVYCNQDTSYKGSNNNLFIGTSITDSNSEPFTVIGTPDELTAYYVVDMDIATHGSILPDFDLSIPMRRESDTGGFPFSDELYLGGYVTESGEWMHLTVVGDIKNNVAKVYINGVYAADLGLAVRNVAGDANRMGSDTRVVAQGVRIELTRNNIQVNMNQGDNVAFDNLSYRLYANGDESLAAAVESGDLNNWDKNTLGRSGEKLAPVATVNGVTYSSEAQLANALQTNDVIEVEFLHQPIVPLTVKANATIQTNGMDINTLVVFDSGCSEPVIDGTKYTVTHPYVANRIEENYAISNGNDTGKLFTTVKGNASGNLLNAINYVSATNISNIGKPGYRSVTIVTNPFTGESMVRESAIPNDAGKLSEANEYMNFKFSTNIKYEAGKNEYIVVDMDYAYDELVDGLMFQIIPRNNGGRWAEALQHSKIGLNPGEMVHLTMVHDYTNNKNHVFVNGQYVLSVNGGAINGTGHSEYLAGATMPVQEFKMGSNSLSTVYYDNVNIRFFDLAAADDTLAAAIASGNIADWSDNIYTSDYHTTQLPAIATVDGVEYGSASALSQVLRGNFDAPLNVSFLHQSYDKVTVTCDAVIKTNGFDINLEFAAGKKTVGEDGTIYFDCNYVSDTEYVLEKNTANFSNAVISKDSGNIISSIFYNEGNCFMNTSWYDVNGNKVEGLHSYLVKSTESDNVYGMFARPVGSSGMIGFEAYDENGNKTYDLTGTYFNMEFSSGKEFTYSASENNYWVYDFDVAVEGEAIEMYGYNLIKTEAGGFQYGGHSHATSFAIQVAENGKAGEFNHITVVADYNNNTQYVFVNGVFTGEGALMVNGLDGAYVEGAKYINNGFRVSLMNSDPTDGQTMAIDNIYAAKYTTSNAGNLEEAIAAGDITLWANSRYTDSYSVPTLHTLGTVNGVEYNSAEAIAEAVKAAGGVANVELLRTFRGNLALAGNATVETHGLTTNVVAAKTGWFELDTKNEYYGDNGIVKVSGKYFVTSEGTVYTVDTVTSDNYAEHTTLVTWYTTPGSYDTYVDVLYLFGDQIVAPETTGEYIVDGQLIYNAWYLDGDADETIVDTFPVSSAELGTLNYMCKQDTKDCDFAVSGFQVGMTVGTNFDVDLYVPADGVVTDGVIINMGGIDYLVLHATVAANRVANAITFQFNVVDAEGNVYVQYQTVTVLGYAEDIMASNLIDLADKTLLVAALTYANEAYAILGGSTNSAVTAFLAEYADFAPEAAELGTVYETSDMKSVIRSAALKLDTAPAMVFKVAMGFKGEIKFTYNSLGEEVVVVKTVDATAGEQLVVVDSFKAYDIHSDIAIEITPENGEAITGTYNLSTYANGLENNAFAVALLTYAQLAEANWLNFNPSVPTYSVTVDGEVIGTYEEGSKIAAPEYAVTDGYKAVWTVNGEAWDFENDVITSDITLVFAGEVLDIVVKDVADVQDATLTTINTGKIKQFDQSNVDDGSNEHKNGWFLKEGGTPVYVDAVKDNESVEALYFSRDDDWTTYASADQNAGFSETRWAISGGVTSITFSYLINGTVEPYAGSSTGTNLDGETAPLTSAFVQLNTNATEGAAGDTYPEIMGDKNNDGVDDYILIADGEWHTFTITFDSAVETSKNFLVKLYHFQGEFLIADINVQY